jgi:hypothetical protein
MNTPHDLTTSPAVAPSSNGQLDSLPFVRASLASVQANIFVADANDRERHSRGV